MYQAIVRFRYRDFEQDPVQLINHIVEQWRYNGQIIGREVGITYHQGVEDAEFQLRVAVPEQESLAPKWQNERVAQAIAYAEEQGIVWQSVEIIGRDYNAEQTSPLSRPNFQLLYTTHLDSCSPVYNGEDFCPQPLYRLGISAELSEAIIKWQEDWQACDQLQMNGSVLETAALAEISDHSSHLSRQGQRLCRQLEQQTAIPTYYYLYRLGKNSELEHNRRCPSCHGEWRLPEPLHGIFHFKCDHCRLISNLSWEVQG
ncbi:hypothetical protein RO21_01250 [[Actinobacillus] muris]|uniref:Zn-ribbon-containing protein n=1 Tax=Muribacter muris TaxID=67855 RepID=A0A0J5P811_9PAST|nr:Zn-ribbon-containing protein [Muribacter muris]KMK52361.1 hypothetical protein RO21_01250 [[Actinobacillus] muris] [Muribacter muris]